MHGYAVHVLLNKIQIQTLLCCYCFFYCKSNALDVCPQTIVILYFIQCSNYHTRTWGVWVSHFQHMTHPLHPHPTLQLSQYHIPTRHLQHFNHFTSFFWLWEWLFTVSTCTCQTTVSSGLDTALVTSSVDSLIEWRRCSIISCLLV